MLFPIQSPVLGKAADGLITCAFHRSLWERVSWGGVGRNDDLIHQRVCKMKAGQFGDYSVSMVINCVMMLFSEMPL